MGTVNHRVCPDTALVVGRTQWTLAQQPEVEQRLGKQIGLLGEEAERDTEAGCI